MTDPESMAETVTRTGARPSTPGPDQAQLRVVYPEALSTTIVLPPEPLVLGRKPESERGARLPHPTVSRRHFSIEWDIGAAEHRGVDLGSHNGSRVNGARLGAAPVTLQDGAVLRLGDVLLVYERNPGVEVNDPSQVSHQAIPGRAASTKRLRAMLARAGPDPSPVLLVGETGTGKEFLAREMHRLSGRSGAMLAINCAALSPQLIESQLFGHARGAFTGAQQPHPGLFRSADGGTLLLDEVGELPADLQPKLLRALQEREVLGVGETRPVPVDVRIIAATLRDIGALARAGQFRLDLYARLSLWEIHVPALRERRADILEWVRRLIERWHAERSTGSVAPVRFDADAAEWLLLQDWPDNIRGLDRLVHRLCAERPDDDVGVARLEGWLAAPPGAAAASAPQAVAAEAPRPAKPSRAELERVLAQHGGSVRATAKHFDRDRRQIYRWMEQYGLRKRESD